MKTPDPYQDPSHIYAGPNLDEGREGHSKLDDPVVDHPSSPSRTKPGWARTPAC